MMRADCTFVRICESLFKEYYVNNTSGYGWVRSSNSWMYLINLDMVCSLSRPYLVDNTDKVIVPHITDDTVKIIQPDKFYVVSLMVSVSMPPREVWFE